MSFQLYKKRSFGDLISDTFLFLKHSGKHFFRNYFTICGVLLILLTVISYFISNVFFTNIFSGINSIGNNGISSPFSKNSGLMLLLGLLFLLFVMIIGLVNYTFPVLYFKLFERHKSLDFGTSEIINEFKIYKFKMLKFLLASILLYLPVIIIVYGVLVVLSLSLIGFPLMMIIMPTFMCIVVLSYYNYLEDTSVKFSTAFTMSVVQLKRAFIAIVGANITINFIVQIVTTIIVMIPYIFIIAMVFGLGTTSGLENDSPMGLFPLIFSLVLILVMLLSFIMNNLILINLGLAYYSDKEVQHNVSSKDLIDSIGQEIEE